MKRHEGKTVIENDVVTKGLYDENTVNEENVVTNGQKISSTSETIIALDRRVFDDLEEFNRKTELGRYVKLIVANPSPCDRMGIGLHLDYNQIPGRCIRKGPFSTTPTILESPTLDLEENQSKCELSENKIFFEDELL